MDLARSLQHSPLFETVELLSHAPWRQIGPALERLRYELRAFSRVASRAGIRDFQRFRGAWGDEFERVGPDVAIGYGLFDLGHVTGHALVPGTPNFVMRVRLNRGRVGAVRGVRAMAFETKNVRWFDQISAVLRTVNIVAAKAAHAVRVHLTGNKVIALHPVLVCGSVGEVGE